MRGPRGTLIPSLASTANNLRDVMRTTIQSRGPMTVSEYMRLSLSHQDFGYYMRKDVFGRKGDFTTSPEISQLFGEMVGVWCSSLLEKLSKSGPRWQMVEFGPGRGSLSIDILRAVRDVRSIEWGSLHLIEISPELKKIQQAAIQDRFQKWGMDFQRDLLSPTVERLWRNNFSVTWYPSFNEFVAKQLIDKEKDPTILIAHEFFDALPIHQFQYFQSKGWCERLIDVNPSGELEFVVSDGPTDNSRTILKPEKRFSLGISSELRDGDMIEVPDVSMKQMMDICEFMKIRDSALLAIDYGENHSLSNSLRAIKDHKKLEDGWLNIPGEADLSAYVDFSSLRTVTNYYKELKTVGPIPQGAFLEAMGISLRLEMLQEHASVEQGKLLESECERLVSPEHMGEIYKFLYVGKASLGETYPFLDSLNFTRKK